MIVFYFDLHWFYIQYNFWSKNYLLFMIYNFSWLKRFLLSLIILSLIASFSFFSLKRFLILLIVLTCISLFSLKRFFTYLIILSSLFLPFSSSFLFSDSKRVLSVPKILFKLFPWAFYCLNCSILLMTRKRF